MSTRPMRVRSPGLPCPGALALVLALLAAPGPAPTPPLAAQQQPTAALRPIAPLKGMLERIVVHGRSLAGNLSGDSPARAVTVYLPPGYGTSGRRYPVVYVLHGYTDDDEHWMGWKPHFVNLPLAYERGLAAGTVRELILVMPNAYTSYAGSMYGSSVTTGDWESYVAEDLVSYIDAHYRTVPERASRGLAGHSMGGYGTIRIGLKRPDVFAVLYAMSPGGLDPRLLLSPEASLVFDSIGTRAQYERAGFLVKATFAVAASWSPNPARPPFYLDLPVQGGQARPEVQARWAANAPLAMVHQYIPALKRYAAIGLDCGAQDGTTTADTRELDRVLTLYGIPHFAEIYDPGNHISRVEERVERHVLPFFSRHLSFPGAR